MNVCAQLVATSSIILCLYYIIDLYICTYFGLVLTVEKDKCIAYERRKYKMSAMILKRNDSITYYIVNYTQHLPKGEMIKCEVKENEILANC